jgi:hypothetical protein
MANRIFGAEFPCSLARLTLLFPIIAAIACESHDVQRPAMQPLLEPTIPEAADIEPSAPAERESAAPWWASIYAQFATTDPALRQMIIGRLTRSYPERLSSKWDIAWASADATEIDIRDLPLEDYPLLKKFKHAQQISLDNRNSDVATDAHLEALASVGFREVDCIGLDNCRLITDKGIRALSKIQPLPQLALEGTSITDQACDVMAHTMHLTGVNIANCSKVSFRGIKALAACPAMEGLSFSADTLTREQVLEVLAALKDGSWCGIVDPQRKLNADALIAKAAQRNITLVISSTGALQDTWQNPKP